MTLKKNSFTHEDLRTVAIACGSVAFLIAVAVFIAPQSAAVTSTTPEANLAATQGGDFHSNSVSVATNGNDSTPPDPVITPSTDPLRLDGTTDTSWKQSRTLTTGWEQKSFNDTSWSNAVDEGPFNTRCIAPSIDPASDHWQQYYFALIQYNACLVIAGTWAGLTGFPLDTPAHWIWYHDTRGTGNGDSATVYFRKTFVAKNEGAKLIITGDDIYTVYLNGVAIGTDNNWKTGETIVLSMTPGNTYVLAVSVKNNGGSGGLLAELDQSPKLNLSATSVVGKTTVTWSTENANGCTVAGPGISGSGKSGSETFSLTSGQFPAAYTLKCTVPITVQKQVTIKYPSNWFTVYGGLFSYGDDTSPGGSESPANRVLNGWPAPLGCEIVNDHSEEPCFTLHEKLPPAFPPRTTYGIISAFERVNPSNGKYALFNAKNTGGRHDVKTWDATWTAAVTPTPTLTVPVGTPVTLEWSCVPYQYDWFEDNCGLFGLANCTVTYNDSGKAIALFSGSKGTNFSTGGANRGYVTVTPPAGGETYTLSCMAANGTASPAVSINVNKSGPTLPTLTIQALLNNVPLLSHIVVGTPVVLHGTYAAAPDDTITGAAINGGVNDKNTAACQGKPATCTVPVFSNSNKNAVLDYVFAPTLAGTYTFYPAAKTAAYESSGYVNYGNVSTQVVVDCPAGVPSCPKIDSVCPPGYVMDTNGVCQPVDVCSNMPGDQTSVPTNCSQVGTECLPNSGYMIQGAQCVPVGVINSFEAYPPRVRKGGTVTFTWSVSNMKKCGITGSDGSTPAAYTAANGTNGVHTATATVQQATNYTLSCTDGVNNRSAQKLVGLIPAYEEI